MKGDQDELCMCGAADLFLIVDFFFIWFSLIHFNFLLFNNKKKKFPDWKNMLVRSSGESNAEGLVPLRGQQDSFSSLTAGKSSQLLFQNQTIVVLFQTCFLCN